MLPSSRKVTTNALSKIVSGLIDEWELGIVDRPGTHLQLAPADLHMEAAVRAGCDLTTNRPINWELWKATITKTMASDLERHLSCLFSTWRSAPQNSQLSTAAGSSAFQTQTATPSYPQSQ